MGGALVRGLPEPNPASGRRSPLHPMRISPGGRGRGMPGLRARPVALGFRRCPRLGLVSRGRGAGAARAQIPPPPGVGGNPGSGPGALGPVIALAARLPGARAPGAGPTPGSGVQPGGPGGPTSGLAAGHALLPARPATPRPAFAGRSDLGATLAQCARCFRGRPAAAARLGGVAGRRCDDHRGHAARGRAGPQSRGRAPGVRADLGACAAPPSAARPAPAEPVPPPRCPICTGSSFVAIGGRLCLKSPWKCSSVTT